MVDLQGLSMLGERIRARKVLRSRSRISAKSAMASPAIFRFVSDFLARVRVHQFHRGNSCRQNQDRFIFLLLLHLGFLFLILLIAALLLVFSFVFFAAFVAHDHTSPLRLIFSIEGFGEPSPPGVSPLSGSAIPAVINSLHAVYSKHCARQWPAAHFFYTLAII
jgi:hypothetical protein